MTLSDAEAHAGLGLPVAKGVPRRLLKRLVARVGLFVLRPQVAFNAEVLAALRDQELAASRLSAELGALTAHLDDRLSGLGSRNEELSAVLSAALTAQQDTNTAETTTFGELWEAVAAQSAQIDSRSSDLWHAITAQASHFESLNADLWTAVQEQTNQVDSLGADLWSAVNNRWQVLQDLQGRVDDLGLAIGRSQQYLEEQVTALKLHVDLMQRQAFARHHEGLGELRGELVEMSLELAELGQRLDSASSEMRRRQAIVDALLDEVRRSLPAPVPPEALAKLPGAMDLMYPAFEEVFRGPSQSISGLLKDYLPDVLALDRHGPVVDLGSGRGEWLAILADAGVDAYGVDTSHDFVDRCQERGLKVVLADACEHLAGLAERSLSAVTAFHLVEHIGIDRLVQLIDLCVRALEPGGLLIFETPNPDNLIVGSSSFYLDPSHLRPIPPGLLAFLVEARGLADVEVRLLHPNSAGNLVSPSVSAPWSADLAPLVAAVNARLYGPQDYAVVGRRL